jgi:hypothetical protein
VIDGPALVRWKLRCLPDDRAHLVGVSRPQYLPAVVEDYRSCPNIMLQPEADVRFNGVACGARLDTLSERLRMDED